MALTNKQVAAKIMQRELQKMLTQLDTLEYGLILSVAQQLRLKDNRVNKIREDAKDLLKPSIKRVDAICNKIGARKTEAAKKVVMEMNEAAEN